MYMSQTLLLNTHIHTSQLRETLHKHAIRRSGMPFGPEVSDEEEGDMVLFSQILRSVGDHPPGIAEDDDEIDGAVFFGDADEMREL